MLRKLTNPYVVKIREINKNVKNGKANICQALGHFKFMCFSQNSHGKAWITLTVTTDKFVKILLNLISKNRNKSFL